MLLKGVLGHDNAWASLVGGCLQVGAWYRAFSFPLEVACPVHAQGDVLAQNVAGQVEIVFSPGSVSMNPKAFISWLLL